MYKLTNSTSIIRLSDNAFIPADDANTDYQAYLKWLAEGNTPQPVDPPSPQQVEAQLTSAIQQRLDTFAQQRGYDNILSACTYATSSVPKFQSEGQNCVNLRDATWSAAYAVLADVQANTRPIPTETELFAELPVLTWPN